MALTRFDLHAFQKRQVLQLDEVRHVAILKVLLSKLFKQFFSIHTTRYHLARIRTEALLDRFFKLFLVSLAEFTA